MYEQIVFYVFSALLVFSAGMVITMRNPVHAAIFLVLAFFSSAAVWLLLEAEFLAIVLVLVYVGAVMVLFLFVVMMLDINFSPLREGFMRWLPLGGAVAVAMAVAMMSLLGSDRFGPDRVTIPERRSADYSNTAELGAVLYTDYVYPFEIAAVILLVAIVAAITLTMRTPRPRKRQDPAEQVRVRSEDRVRIVKMKVEEKQ